MSLIGGIHEANQEMQKKDYLPFAKHLATYPKKHVKPHIYGTSHSIDLCCLQNITSESEYEILPFKDKEAHLVINADAIIDNRQELFRHLHIPKEDQNISDSQLILKAYKKWGIECPKHLVGGFVFVIWDQRKNTFFLVRDHVGEKILYYYQDENRLIYSSLTDAFFKVKDFKRKLDKVYLGDFLALNWVMHSLGPSRTIYENITLIPAGTAILIDGKRKKEWHYWDASKIKKIKMDSDQAYAKAFKKLWTKVVQEKCRTNGQVGCYLSGGLDSSSVAVIAASRLRKEGKMLKSYTQIPFSAYKDYLPEQRIADEREFVEEIVRFSGNIRPKYVASEGKDMYTEINELLKIYEQPYKIFENSTWIKEIQEEAIQDKVKVLLTGQSGNATISWGIFHPYCQTLLKSFRLKKLFHEIASYSQLHKSQIWKESAKVLLNVFPHLKKIVLTILGHKQDFLLSPINPRFYQQMHIKERFRACHMDNTFMKTMDARQYRQTLINQTVFSHLGSIWGKMSLYYGTVTRDPTMDYRIIEFCFGLPGEQYVRDGKERRFIRYAMKGSLPDKVRLNEEKRGKQAADMIQRIIGKWPSIRQDLQRIGDNSLEEKIMNIDLIDKLIKAYDVINIDDTGDHGIRLLFRALIVSKFIEGRYK